MPKLSLDVSEDFVLPEWFASAAPNNVGQALQLAALVMPFAAREATAIDVRVEEAKQRGLREAIDMATDAAATRASKIAGEEVHRAREELAALRASACAQTASADARIATNELSVRQEERSTAEERTRGVLESMRASHDLVVTVLKERAEEATTEHRHVTARLEASDAHRRELEQENARLRTPNARGTSGEANVSDVLCAAGFKVIDTSAGSVKEQYGDLLAVVDQDDDDDEEGKMPRTGLRIAIEVKNRARIDTRDLTAFAEKVRRGMRDGRYDGAILVSLRAWLPGPRPPVRVDLAEDEESRRPIGPVAYLGCERRQPVVPLTAEQVEVHVHAVAEIARIAMRARHTADAATPLTDADATTMRELVAAHAAHTAELFQEFGRHQVLIEQLRKSLDAMRTRVLVHHRRTGRACHRVPWIPPETCALPWERYLEHAIRLQSEGRLEWSNVTNKSAVLSAVGGREVATAAIAAELREIADEGTRKRVRPG